MRSVFESDHEALRDSVAKFLATEPADFFGPARDLGFVGLAEVEDVRFAAVVLEEVMNAGRPEIALALAMHDSYALPILDGRAAALAAVVEGSIRAEAATEGWVLRGSAEGVVNGLAADVLVVRATTDDGSDLLFAVPGDAVDRRPGDVVLGLDHLDIADLRLDGVTVPAADRLATDLAAARGRHQVALAVAAVAGARTALRITVAYVSERKAFGKPIATFENTRHTLGVLGAQVAAVEAFVDSLLASMAAGNAVPPGRAAAAKLTATELLGAAVDQGVQLHGGYGYMWEYPIARAYAAARYFKVLDTGGSREVLASAIGL